MTKELQTKFLEQLTSDEILQNDLAKSKSPEEAHKVVMDAGYKVSLDEFKTAMGQLNSIVSKKNGELSENDLEMVAGGRSFSEALDNTVKIVDTTFQVVTAAASAAG